MAEEIYRPGLEGIIAGETAISTISGGLAYRGYSVDELARNATFDEVAYLLLHGELPTRAARRAAAAAGGGDRDRAAGDRDAAPHSSSCSAHGCDAHGVQHARTLGPRSGRR